MRLRWALLAGVMCPASVLAQTAVPPPVRPSVDANGVDLFLGSVDVARQDVAIGPQGQGGLSYSRIWRAAGAHWVDNFDAHLYKNGSTITVVLGDSAEDFTLSGSTYTNAQGGASTLVTSSSGFTYTAGDGAVYQFSTAQGYSALDTKDAGRVLSITRSSGEVITYNYGWNQVCTKTKPGGSGDACISRVNGYRLSNITNNFGYALSFSYNQDDAETPDQLSDYYTVLSVTASNRAVCALGTSCSTAWPTASYNHDASAVDAAGRSWGYSVSAQGMLSIKRPGTSNYDLVFSYDSSGRVSKYTTPNTSTTYGYADNGTANTRTTTVTNAAGKQTIYIFNLTSHQMTSSKDANGNTTNYSYDSYGRMLTVKAPLGNSAEFQYDSRGNVLKTILHSSNTSLPDITKSAAFGNDAANAKVRNQPSSTTDERGNVTSYGYDAGTGLITSATLPAPASGAAQPQIRYGYAGYQAYYNTGSGIVASGQTITLLTTVSQCRTAGSCSGGSDEQKITYGYGPQASGTANNLARVSTTVTIGDGSVSATTQTGYDVFGNVATTTDPVGATTWRYWNAAHQPTWVVGDGPGGGGDSTKRAVAISYDAYGRVSQQQVGTAKSDTSSFSAVQTLATGYDGDSRQTSQVLTSGGTTYSVTQMNYDGVGRLQCTAVRQQLSNYAGDACAQSGTQSADGPDRIEKRGYDDGDRLTSVTTGYATSPSATVSYSYTANDKLQLLTDANGQGTGYTYDGFDRLTTTTYPGGSTEVVTYGPSGGTTGLVTSRKLRDGSSIGYGYDALARVTSMSPQSIGSGDEAQTLSYDNLNHLLSATSSSGHNVSYGYDALGRLTSETSRAGTKSFGYDAGGRLTSFKWPDGVYVTYGYNALGAMTTVNENGSTMLVQYFYDSLGRRTSVGRGNNIATSYTYDAASRMTGLSFGPAGGSAIQALGFSYNAAGQITGRTSSNDAYAWTQSYNLNRPYSVNGLNQYTAAGTVAPTYDARGNLTSAGSTSYSYNRLNELISAGGSNSFAYDSVGRLDTIGQSSTVLDHAGDQLVSEYSGNASSVGGLLRRYVYGADAAPVLWYEGAGTGDRRWLIPDERGSVVAVTNGDGSTRAVNAYDEYGIPQATNQGRFGYTGQAWVPELGMSYYRARIYSPTLGRFLQTDPIGYQDGPNWYNYTGDDPVNGTDPSGTECADICINGVRSGGGGSGAFSIGGALGLVPSANVTGPRLSWTKDDDSFTVTGRRKKTTLSTPQSGLQLAANDTPGIGHNGPPPEVAEGDIVVMGTARVLAEGVSVFVLRGSVALSLLIPTDSAGESEEVLRNLAAHNSRGHRAITLANPSRDYDISQGVKNTLDAQKTRATWFDVVKRFLHALTGE